MRERFFTHLRPLLDRLAKTFSAQPAGHIVGGVRLPALVDGKHPARSRLKLPARTLHQEAAMGPAEACQAVLAVRGGEDEVPWGEGGVSAPS